MRLRALTTPGASTGVSQPEATLVYLAPLICQIPLFTEFFEVS